MSTGYKKDIEFKDLSVSLQTAFDKVYLQWRWFKGDLNPGEPMMLYSLRSRKIDYFMSLDKLIDLLNSVCDMKCIFMYDLVNCAACDKNPLAYC